MNTSQQPDPVEQDRCGIRCIHKQRVDEARQQALAHTENRAMAELFKAMGDALRLKWGFDVETDDSSSELYDASYLRR